MDIKYGLISVDDHVLEHPRVWEERLSKRSGRPDSARRAVQRNRTLGRRRSHAAAHGRGSVGALCQTAPRRPRTGRTCQRRRTFRRSD